MYLNNDSLDTFMYLLSSRSHGTSLPLLQNLFAFMPLLCSKISTMYILAIKSSFQDLMVLSTFKYTSSSVSEAQGGGRSAPINTELMMISAGPRARTPPAADGRLVVEVWLLIKLSTKYCGRQYLLNFWFYHTLLATGIQLGLFRKM